VNAAGRPPGAPGPPAQGARPARAPRSKKPKREPWPTRALAFTGPWPGAALALALYAGALGTFFAGDDIVFLARASGIEPTQWTIARLLSGPLRWRALHAAFGLNPAPYHAVNLALHALNVVLVHRAARRLGLARPAAAAAAVLFGSTSIAFTPLHWVSGGGELMVTTFALIAFERGLAAAGLPAGPAAHGAGSRAASGAAPAGGANARGSGVALVLSAVAFVLALLSKETALLLPLACAAALGVGWRAIARRAAPRPLVVLSIVAATFALALLVTLRGVDWIGGAAYTPSANPLVWLGNLGTYVAWSAPWRPAIPDASAAIDPLAWGVALPLLALLVALAAYGRAFSSRALRAGAAWFLVLLAPLLLLANHTYLYYLYLPWAGACWVAAAIGERLAARHRALGWVLALALVAMVARDFSAVLERETARIGDMPADRVMRESRLLSHVAATLDTLHVPAGSRIAYVNPSPYRRFALVDTTGYEVHGYVPLQAALAGGDAIRVLRPGLRYAGFGTDLPREWEDAEALLYRGDGSARWIGHGSVALAELGYFKLRLRQFAGADSLFVRSLARGDTLPDALFGRVTVAAVTGDRATAESAGREFLRRWPNEPRAGAVRQTLAGARPGTDDAAPVN
jgi:hypothetical protein